MIEKLLTDKIEVGNKIYFSNERLPYKVMAISKRFMIVSRKLNRIEDSKILHHRVEMGSYLSFTQAYEHCKQSPVYSIIDFEEGVRSSDNLIFSIYNYFNFDDCAQAIKDLEFGELELSTRNKCNLSIDLVRSLLE